MRFNRFYSFLACGLFVAACLSFTSMNPTSVSVHPEATIGASLDANDSCTLKVKTSYGSPAKSIKVSTDVSGGVSCIGGRSFYTDSDGEVTLEWSSGCKLKKVYVDGRGYDVDYRDGGNYTITMK